MKKYFPFLFVISVIFLFILGYVYFFQIAPILAEKPMLEKPGSGMISTAHVAYVLNELGSYKLHPEFLSKEQPVIEIYLKDMEKSFFIQVTNGQYREVQQTTPDLKIALSSEEFRKLFSGDIAATFSSALNNNLISLDIIKDQKTLAFKGYKSIYDKLFSNNEITGNVTGFNPNDITNPIIILFVVTITLIIAMIAEMDS